MRRPLFKQARYVPNFRQTAAARLPGVFEGMPGGLLRGLRREDLYTYTVYVRRDDYDKAAAAMRSALRNG